MDGQTDRQTGAGRLTEGQGRGAGINVTKRVIKTCFLKRVGGRLYHRLTGLKGETGDKTE